MSTSNQEPTVAELMKQLAELKAANEQLAKNPPKVKKGPTRTIKMNKSNGLFFSDPCMQAFSVNKNKNYQAGINIQAYQLDAFVAVLNNPELLADMKTMVNTGVEISKQVAAVAK